MGNHEHSGFISEGLHELLEGMGASHELTECIVHFVADTINIFLILLVVMFAVSFLRTFLDFEKLEQRLAKLKSVWGFLLAIVMGMLSPFCSCTIVPVVIGLLSMGVPTVICICFLTSASLLNLTALISFYSIAGASYTAWYVGISLVIIAAVCILLTVFGLNHRKYILSYAIDEREIEHHHHHHGECSCGHDHTRTHDKSLKGRLTESLHGVGHVLHDTWIYILLGVALSSAVMAFVPLDAIAGAIDHNNALSVVLAGLIGAPIHSDMFTIMPLVIMLKDISASVTLTFVTAAMVISVPEVVLLTRAFKPKFLAVYVSIVVLLSMVAGFVVYAVGF